MNRLQRYATWVTRFTMMSAFGYVLLMFISDGTILR